VVLLSPPDRENGHGVRSFTWQPNFQLAAEQAFEVVFWRNGENPFGVLAPVQGTEARVDLTALYNLQRLAQGEYQWSVLLVIAEPYERLQMLNEGRRFTFEPPASAPPPTLPPPTPTAAGGNER
jgi:hypothetical protein